MLNMTKVEPELISDADMYLFFLKGMIGGVYYISMKYSKVLWPKTRIKTYYVLRLLPTSGFKWIDPKCFDSIKYSWNS